jgi:two-component system LytT family response regulator
VNESFPLRVLVVDDERSARKFLRTILAAYPTITLVGEAATVDEAAALATALRPDVVLLDVQMPPASGFDLLPLLPTPAPAVIFATAHDAYAVRAFEVSAVDYLLKPFSEERLYRALQRVAATLARPGASDDEAGRAAAPNPPPPVVPLECEDVLILRDRDRIRRAPLVNIVAVVADAHYTQVHLAGEPALFLLRSIGTWAEQLSAPGFLRADRSLIVNLARVRGVDVHSRDLASLRMEGIERPLAIGRTALMRLRAVLPPK